MSKTFGLRWNLCGKKNFKFDDFRIDFVLKNLALSTQPIIYFDNF